MRTLALFLALTLSIAVTMHTANRDSADVFPGAVWAKATPAELGWSPGKLEEARKFFDTLTPANLVVVHRGKTVVEWGDPAVKFKINSMRKSILSGLYGIHLGEGELLDKTIGQLGIDDEPPITPEEKKATVRMLLEARSGVYHSFIAGTPPMRESMPARGSHAPGTFWYYNNWDFNVLGTIFEQQFHTKIGADFRDRIAVPTQMQDFRLEDMYYERNKPDSPAYEKSLHLAYNFRLTARDLARFGYLFLRHGNWNGTQVVPSNWVEESTRPYTDDTGPSREGAGYGYLWWVHGFGLPVKNFYAHGVLGKFVVVIPERDLVVVVLSHTEFPDNSTLSAEQFADLPAISLPQMGQLLKLLLAAQQASRPT